MKVYLVSYGSGRFVEALGNLVGGARIMGVQEIRPWTRPMVHSLPLLAKHLTILSSPRGDGYWLWKPLIIRQTLYEMAAGDVLIYLDAGMEMVADLAPLIALSDEHEIVLFANHYDDIIHPGAPLCRYWTRRDCFVHMDLDDDTCYDAPMVDASCILVAKTTRGVAFCDEWLTYCSAHSLVADGPNISGLPNLDGFIDHRHDQSVLSLLAYKHRLELFRHPSQFGNHLKVKDFRIDGEWLRYPYGFKGTYWNSRYGTLLKHTRGRVNKSLTLEMNSPICQTQSTVFNAWTSPNFRSKYATLNRDVVLAAATDLRAGGRIFVDYVETGSNSSVTWRGVVFEVLPCYRLEHTWNHRPQLASEDTFVSISFNAVGPDTHVVIKQRFIPDEELLDQYRAEFTDLIEAFQRLIQDR